MSDVESRIANLAEKLHMKMMVRKELKKLPSMLHENEQLVNLVQGSYEGNQGLIVVTEDRVMFIDEGMVRSHREDFPYSRISSVKTSKAILSGKLAIFASGNKAELTDIMPKAQTDVLADYIRHRIAGGGASSPSPQATVPAPAPEADVYEKLHKLGELRDAGVLTQEEFDTKKTSLLAEI